MYSLASRKEHTETGVTLNESIPQPEVTTTQSSLFSKISRWRAESIYLINLKVDTLFESTGHWSLYVKRTFTRIAHIIIHKAYIINNVFAEPLYLLGFNAKCSVVE